VLHLAKKCPTATDAAAGADITGYVRRTASGAPARPALQSVTLEGDEPPRTWFTGSRVELGSEQPNHVRG
jgi:hypothetical protein